MRKKTFLSTVASFLAMLVCYAQYAFAYSCADLSADLSSGEAPSPLGIVCVIGNVIKVVVVVVGLIFVAVTSYGAYKLSMALGDPKAMQGAQQTWTYAVMGVLIVLGFFAAFVVIANVFGIKGFINPNDITERITNAIVSLFSAAGITGATN
jgi:hypothetical protein